ncbi:MAG TPA: lasso peptide biosynthesis B2 protein [Caldilineaceae bacterium]|nr:lasso peptide biosynthesis B2 protein [Caldilineaceae bacterium]
MPLPIEKWRKRLAAALLLCEAFVYLLAARCALGIVPFRHLTRWMERRPRQPELTGPDRQRTVQEVRRAIFQIWHQSPLPTTCLHRAIAAQSMLRRRGVGTTLYYGAATRPAGELKTHAWVQDGNIGVVGYRVAWQDRYQVLARYPE